MLGEEEIALGLVVGAVRGVGFAAGVVTGLGHEAAAVFGTESLHDFIALLLHGLISALDYQLVDDFLCCRVPLFQ